MYCGSINKGNTVADDIHKLMVLCDDEFKPRLSKRTDAVRALSAQIGDAHPMNIEPYFEIILQQKNIIAIVDGNIGSFMSFKHDFDKPYYFPAVLREGDSINYITTICTHPDFRGKKLATQLYDYIEKSLSNDVRANCVATRTWNTNIGHIGLLQKRGYKLTCTLHEDRKDDDGTVLDTVYYCKRLEA